MSKQLNEYNSKLKCYCHGIRPDYNNVKDLERPNNDEHLSLCLISEPKEHLAPLPDVALVPKIVVCVLFAIGAQAI